MNVLLRLPREEWVDFIATKIVGSIALTWVLGITYMLTVTLSVLQLREVLHPDILAKGIRPQVSHHHIISYHIVSYYMMSYHTISYHIVSYRIISYRIILYHIASYHIASYRIASYHIVSYYIISYHITFNCSIFQHYNWSHYIA